VVQGSLFAAGLDQAEVFGGDPSVSDDAEGREKLNVHH